MYKNYMLQNIVEKNSRRIYVIFTHIQYIDTYIPIILYIIYQYDKKKCHNL